jgi:hypothetical protein
MVVFALMLACITSFPSSIARDTEIGLLIKLRTIPIKPEIGTLERLIAYLIFASAVAGLVTLVGLGIGAHFSGGLTADLESIGFLLMAVVAATGIGLILGSFIKSVQATAFIGLVVVLVFSFVRHLGSISNLPTPLQAFSRTFPISSASSSIYYLMLGQDVTGYNPLTTSQIAKGTVLAFILFAIGLFPYQKASWSQDSGMPNPLKNRQRQMRIRKIFSNDEVQKETRS